MDYDIGRLIAVDLLQLFAVAFIPIWGLWAMKRFIVD